jgi:hypothetical protein
MNRGIDIGVSSSAAGTASDDVGLRWGGRVWLVIGVVALIAMLYAGPGSGLARADAPTVGTPSWWSGDCDADGYRGAHRLGAVWNGLVACGPRPIADNAADRSVRFANGLFPALEWECVELSLRWMYLAYGVRPYSGNGDDLVDNYTSSDGGGLVRIANGTPGEAPQPGDVMEFRSADHTGVVASSSVDGAGNGSMTMIEQNASSTGWGTFAVHAWSVAGATAWLDKPGGSGGGTGVGNGGPSPTLAATTLSYGGATTGVYDDAVTLSAQLVSQPGSGGVSGRSVGFTLGSQSCSATTDASGDASCSVTLTQAPGDYTVTASFTGDAVYSASSSGTEPFTVNQAPTKTSYGGPATSEFYAPFTASATLVDADTGSPISAEAITLTLGASDSCSGMTDSTGTVTCSITPTQTPGSYNVVASFAGDPLYLGSHDTQPFTITKAETTTTMTAVPPGSSTFGQPVTFSATSASNNAGAPTPTGSTVFTVDGTPAGSSSLTAGSGSTGTSSLSAGSHTISGSYGGDADFLPSTGSLPYTVTCDVNINANHEGSLTVTTTTCLSSGAHVDGSIIVKPGGSLDLEGASITGALDANTGGVIRVCSSTIGGALDIKNSTGIVIVGDPAIGCAPNQIGGALSAQNNDNGAEIINNTASGAIITDGNTGPGPYPGDPTTITGNGPPTAPPITIPVLGPPANPGSTPTPLNAPAPQNAPAPASSPPAPAAPKTVTPPPAGHEISQPAPAAPATPHALTSSKPLTKAQKLAAAITTCNKLKKTKRPACIATAKKRYRRS